jgi:hypothetical protein
MERKSTMSIYMTKLEIMKVFSSIHCPTVPTLAIYYGVHMSTTSTFHTIIVLYNSVCITVMHVYWVFVLYHIMLRIYITLVCILVPYINRYLYTCTTLN